ncbi:MAG TPA: hypothetical protein VFF16_09420 [Telluria sp.]|nr:hypothetical protein [Telluria sp.]
MSAKVVELDVGVHQRVQRLLAFDGALTEQEQQLVEHHAESCGVCAEELLWQRKLKAVQPSAGAAPDMEAALGRLLPRLEERPRASRRGGWMPWALAAQFVLLLALGAFSLQQHQQYRLLGEKPSAAEANLIVVFRPETSDRHLQAILQYHEARVVGGPTETHAWLVRVAPDKVDAVRRALRAEPAVQLAESLQGAR